jgi:hypothetical protein
LQNAPENIQEYILPLSNGNLLKTGSLPSQVEKIENKIVVKTALPNNATLEQSYRLDEATYQIDYEVKIVGNPGLDVSKPVSIRWVDNLTRLEKIIHTKELIVLSISKKWENQVIIFLILRIRRLNWKVKN